MKGGYTYIVTNKPFGILYVGVTANIAERILAHREGRGRDSAANGICEGLS